MATPTALPTSFTAGDVLTAANLNLLRGAFRILQVVSTVKTDTFSSTSTSYVDYTGMSVSITPTSSSSKVLIVVHMVNGYSVNLAASFQIVRGSTAIALGDAAGSRTQCTIGVIPEDASAMVCSMTFLDSPATTSATTYKIQGRSNTGTVHINRTNGDADNANSWRSISTITAYEVSA